MPNDTRYAPPQAPVADPPDLPLLSERPRQVALAVKLLWLRVALDAISVVLAVVRAPASMLEPLVFALTAAFTLLTILLIVKIAQGRNWARITDLALTLLGLLIALTLLATNEPNPPSMVENILTVLVVLTGLVAMYLLFTRPGSLWFQRRG